MALVPELLQLAYIELRGISIQTIGRGTLQRVPGQGQDGNLPAVENSMGPPLLQGAVAPQKSSLTIIESTWNNAKESEYRDQRKILCPDHGGGC